MVVVHSGGFYVQTRGKQELIISLQQHYTTEQEAKNSLYEAFLAAISHILFLPFFVQDSTLEMLSLAHMRAYPSIKWEGD